jgi:hypothetical protein
VSLGVVPEEPPPDPFGVEAIVAAIGARAFFEKSLRQVHGYHVERAGKFKSEAQRLIYRFLQREEPESTSELPDFDYEEVAQLLDDEQLPGHVEQQIAAFGEHGETALAVQVQLQRIGRYLKTKLPRRVHMSLSGPEYSRPAEIDIARFARAWAVACDPLIVLRDLNEYSMSRDQVTALYDLFPTLAASMQPTVQDQLVRAKTVDPKFHLYRQKETLLRVLTRQEQPNIELGKAMQDMYKKQLTAAKPAPKPTPAKHDSGADSESTSSQRIDD